MNLKKLDLPYIKRMFKFGLVGGSGVFVNMFFLWLFTDILHIYYVIAGLCAIELSILNNFFLNYIWTFSDRRNSESKSWYLSLFQYHISVSFGALVNLFVLWLLPSVFGIQYLIANGIGILIGFALNFFFSNRWVFK